MGDYGVLDGCSERTFVEAMVESRGDGLGGRDTKHQGARDTGVSPPLLEVQGEKWFFRFQGAPGLHLSGIGKSDYGTLGLILWPWTVPFLNNEQLLEFLTILWYISASW